jgi:hypothetical protein
MPEGTCERLYDWKRAGDNGACRSIGHCRYFHTLRAPHRVLPNLDLPNTAQMETPITAHIIDSTTLVTSYRKGR